MYPYTEKQREATEDLSRCLMDKETPWKLELPCNLHPPYLRNQNERPTAETEERKAHHLDHQRTKKGLKIPLLWLNLVKQPIPVLLWNSCKRQEAVQSHQSHFYKVDIGLGD